MEKKKCKSCKKTKLNKKEITLLIIAGYIFVTSVYGTIHFIKHFFQT